MFPIISFEELNKLQNYYVQKGVEAWKKYGKLIIGVDFDETILPYNDLEVKITQQVIYALKEARKLGATIILYTCRDGMLLEEALALCEDEGLHFDQVNPTEKFHPSYSHKPYFNVLLDDKAGLISAVQTLLEIITNYKNEINIKSGS